MLVRDFSSVDTVLLKRLYLLFRIELDTRRVPVTGITAHPTSSRVVQHVRNLTMVLEDRIVPVRFLIRGRDTTFSSSFDEVVGADDIQINRTRSEHLESTLAPSGSSGRFVGSASTGR